MNKINFRFLLAGAYGLSIFLISLVTYAAVPSWEITSENDTFRLMIRPEGARVQISQYHNWILTIKDASGNPIENAGVSITGDMKDHGHDLPSQPVVTKYLQNGKYLIEGILFNMSGRWTLNIYIQTLTQADRGRFDVELSF